MGLEWWIGAIAGWIVTGWVLGATIDRTVTNLVAGKKVLAGYYYGNDKSYIKSSTGVM